MKRLAVAILLLAWLLQINSLSLIAAPAWTAGSFPPAQVTATIAGQEPGTVAARTIRKTFFPIVGDNFGYGYYISPNGIDPSNCSGGTAARPWRTWAKAQSCVKAGATVYFMPGSYSRVFSGWSKNEITFKGAPGRPIQIMPAAGAQGQVHFYDHPLVLSGQYGVLSGIDIELNSPTTGVSVYASHLTLEYNRIHNTRTLRCVNIFNDVDSVTVANNEIYNCGMDTGNTAVALETTGGTNVVFKGNDIHDSSSGIEIKGGAVNVLVENNRIHDLRLGGVRGSNMACSGGACGTPRMHDPAVTIADRFQARDVTVRNNLLYNIGSMAVFETRGWVNYSIYNNTVFNAAGWTAFDLSDGAWEFFDQTALGYCSSHKCYTCPVYAGPRPCVFAPLPSRDGKIYNNIVTGPKRFVTISQGNTTGLQMGTNLYYAPGISSATPGTVAMNRTVYTLSQFQLLGYEAGSLFADPRFVSSTLTNPNLRLSNSSPAIDRGTLLPSVTRDLDGTLRPQGATYDIGAYEFARR